MSSRPDWDHYFMNIAVLASTRATCDRRHVGCVLVEEKQIIATGYNGSIPGQPHCDDAGHLMIDGHCARTLHAEQNCLMQAARRGATVRGATAYVTAMPCWLCCKLLLSAGISKIIYGEAYRLDPLVEETCASLNVPLLYLPLP